MFPRLTNPTIPVADLWSLVVESGLSDFGTQVDVDGNCLDSAELPNGKSVTYEHEDNHDRAFSSVKEP